MKPRLTSSEREAGRLVRRLFMVGLGAFLGLALLKFGNPPIMESWVNPPANVYEFFLGSPWPITWGYIVLGLISFGGLIAASWKSRPPIWLILLPAFWFLWECAATVQSP